MATQSVDDVLCKHSVLRHKCSICTPQLKVNEAPSVKALEIQVLLKNGAVVTVPVQATDFNFALYVSLVKGGGGVQTETLHIPWDNILLLGLGELRIHQAEAAPKKNQVN